MSQSFRIRSYKRLFSLFALMLLSLPLAAGAWTPEKGKVYLKLSANRFESFANFNVNGDSFDPFADFDDQFSRFRDRNYSLYFETGLNDRLALFGSLTYKDLEQRTKTRFIEIGLDNNGWADVDLGLRYRLTDGPNVFSVSFLAKLPYLYEEEDFFGLGNAQEDFEGRLLWGRSLGRGFYAGLEAGYRLRLDDPSDEMRWLGELGWGAGSFYARVKIDGIRAVDDMEPSTTVGNPLLTDAFDLDRLDVTAGYSITPRWSLEYTYTDTIAGRNTADGDNVQLAVVATF